MLTAHRTTPFEAFANIVQFYPKLTASVAFGVMAAFGRMLPTSRSDEIRAAATQSPEMTVSPAIQRSKRVTTRRPSSKRVPTRKTAKRRKAA